MKPVYEVVSGSILLSKREDFFRLHRDWLLPMMHKIGIRPVLLLMTEIGSYGKFLDIYRYDSLAQYEELTDRLLSHPELQSYYAEVGQCILGSISIEIMREMPYAASVIGDEELAEDEDSCALSRWVIRSSSRVRRAASSSIARIRAAPSSWPRRSGSSRSARS